MEKLMEIMEMDKLMAVVVMKETKLRTKPI